MSEAGPPGMPRAPRGSSMDAVIEVYKKDIDRTLLRENLKLTPEERLRKLVAVLDLVDEVRRAGRGRS